VKVVADESVDQQIVDGLRAHGHDVLYVAELDPGIDDEAVLLRSRESNAILLTADKDFGELVFRQRLVHAGVLLIRLGGLTPATKAKLVALAFEQHAAELNMGFAVLSKGALRLRVTQIRKR
jgi:predicted nuclease of predicted toxin-antitoxin system